MAQLKIKRGDIWDFELWLSSEGGPISLSGATVKVAFCLRSSIESYEAALVALSGGRLTITTDTEKTILVGQLTQAETRKFPANKELFLVVRNDTTGQTYILEPFEGV